MLVSSLSDCKNQQMYHNTDYPEVLREAKDVTEESSYGTLHSISDVSGIQAHSCKEETSNQNVYHQSLSKEAKLLVYQNDKKSKQTSQHGEHG